MKIEGEVGIREEQGDEGESRGRIREPNWVVYMIKICYMQV
jgi:hypothetical protein